MSEENEELSEQELNSLLADLESRAGSGGASSGSAASGADDDEDLEAFLKRLDAEDSASPKADVAEAERDEELDKRFAELDNLQPDDLPARPVETAPSSKKSKKKSKKSKKKSKKTEATPEGDEAAEGADKPSVGARLAKATAKFLVLALPVVALVWVLGAFLASWISAGWLIAIVAVVFALAVPAVASRVLKKGKFAWWAAGCGLLLTVALIAPMPHKAGQALARYGHWPASTVSELAGWKVDNGLVQLNSGLAGVIGGILSPGATGPNELGTEHSLYHPNQPRQVSPTPQQGTTPQQATTPQPSATPQPSNTPQKPTVSPQFPEK